MKHFGKYTLAALLALALGACSKEDSIDSNGSGSQDAIHKLSVTLAGVAGNATTYGVPVEGGEGTLLPGETDVYMFDYAADKTGRLAEIYAAGSYDVSTDGKTLTFSNLGKYDGAQKVFYVVANRSCLGRTLAPEKGTTTEAAFAESLTGELAVDSGDGKAALIATPLLHTGKSAPVIIGTDLSAPINLRRPVARFDIQNPCYGFFAINKIFVSDARLSGNIFYDASRTALPAATADHKTINGPAQSAFENGVDNIVKNVFYLYPTVLGETTITAQCSYEDYDEVKQTVTMRVNSTCRIEANKRYKITVDYDYLTTTFEINVWPWDDGENLYFE